ncbi:MAG: MBOAT family protein [Lachnospiraceae bacterium]|nr:MBOAT family protein [Lachnospiraceae bacterium]
MKNLCLLVFSLFFYAYGEPVYVWLMAASIIVNYFLSLGMSGTGKTVKKDETARRKLCLVISCIFNLFILVFFKYAPFVVENINILTDYLRASGIISIPHLNVPDLENPVGISFYTFQILSYMIDIYKRRYPAERNFLNVATYISMFPQLIAGPIVKYTEVKKKLEKRHVTALAFDRGVKYFIIGLAAKVVLANRVGNLMNDIDRIGSESISTGLAWMGAIAYSLQIYFDFYGYSLMAVGLGKMTGFRFPENFRDPYAAGSMTEFWRRWHITLGRWFREYVYIPLGGNRQGRLKTVRNIFIVWLLTGIWHGAGWNFILWGMMLFVLLISEKMVTGRFLEKHKIISHLYMFILIPCSWVFFFTDNTTEMRIWFARMFGLISKEEMKHISMSDVLVYGRPYIPVLITALIFCVPVIRKFVFMLLRKKVVGTVMCIVLFFLSVFYLASGLENPFLYFRF